MQDVVESLKMDPLSITLTYPNDRSQENLQEDLKRILRSSMANSLSSTAVSLTYGNTQYYCEFRFLSAQQLPNSRKSR